MATVGEQLTAPETGWQRIDDASEFLYYTGTWNNNNPSNISAMYDKTVHSSTKKDAKVFFRFYGQKLRIINVRNYADSTNIQVTIDGSSYSYSNYASSRIHQALVFEKSDLELSNHYITITNLQEGKYFTFDAIDIDDTGYMISLDPTNLAAVAGNSQVTLSWTAVDGATGYNVKRSITAGGPYTTIASNVSGTTYVDTSVTNGTTYYYVVTAVNADGESKNSNEASATPVASVNVLLRVTMIDSSEREYRLSATESDGFVTWFNNHVSTDTTSYAINDSVDRSKEYLSFEKIISFKVIPTVE
ncbi:MAG: hypothetical protein H6Q70_2689 [Firmicutes bacterium]|nr:hypothetical protein [Bacillota bacterium]